MRRRRGEKRAKYRAGGNSRTVGKDRETNSKVATPKSNTCAHKAKIQKGGEIRASVGAEIPGRTDCLMFIWVKENYPNPGRPR